MAGCRGYFVNFDAPTGDEGDFNADATAATSSGEASDAFAFVLPVLRFRSESSLIRMLFRLGLSSDCCTTAVLDRVCRAGLSSPSPSDVWYEAVEALLSTLGDRLDALAGGLSPPDPSRSALWRIFEAPVVRFRRNMRS